MRYGKRKNTDAMTLTLWLHYEANIQSRSQSADKINDPFSKSSSFSKRRKFRNELFIGNNIETCRLTNNI